MSTRDLAYVALFAALTAALGLIPPITLGFVPVPITAQSLGVMLSGAVLGAKRGAFAQVLFLAIVAAGVPALSGGRGGAGVFFGPSGGFLFAFPIVAFVVGWLTERMWARLNPFTSFACNVAGGIGVMYALGVPWLSVVAELPLLKAAMGSAAFIPGDLIKAGIAALVTVTVKRAYPIIRPGHAAL